MSKFIVIPICEAAVFDTYEDGLAFAKLQTAALYDDYVVAEIRATVRETTETRIVVTEEPA